MCEFMSSSIAHLADALAKAQSLIKGAVKDRPNPFFNSSYADLASIWDACREPLSSNGLAVVQTLASPLPPTPGEDTVTVHTLLCHASGEWIKSSLSIVPAKKARKESSSSLDMVPTKDPQALAAAVTHARRIALAAIVGVAQIDVEDELSAEKDQKSPVSNLNSTSPDRNSKTSNQDLDKVDKAGKLRTTIMEKVAEMHCGDTEAMQNFLMSEFNLSLQAIETLDLPSASKIATAILSSYSQWKRKG